MLVRSGDVLTMPIRDIGFGVTCPHDSYHPQSSEASV